MSDTIPFGDVLQAIRDAERAWTSASRNKILGLDTLALFDLDQCEEATSRACACINRAILAMHGDDGRDEAW